MRSNEMLRYLFDLNIAQIVIVVCLTKLVRFEIPAIYHPIGVFLLEVKLVLNHKWCLKGRKFARQPSILPRIIHLSIHTSINSNKKEHDLRYNRPGYYPMRICLYNNLWLSKIFDSKVTNLV